MVFVLRLKSLLFAFFCVAASFASAASNSELATRSPSRHPAQGHYPAGAQRLVAELKERGFNAFVTHSQIEGKAYHRVRLGPLANREEADAALGAEIGGDESVLQPDAPFP